MSRQRLIVTLVAAVLGLGAWLLSRSHFESSLSAGILGVGVYLGAFVLGHILIGVVQGMREAGGKDVGPRQ